MARNAKPLLSANGSEVKTTGHTTVELYLQGLKVDHEMEVAKNLSPFFILGTDFLAKNQAGIDYAIKLPMFTLFDGLIELPFYTCCSPNNCVTLTRNVCVPAYSEALIQVDTPTRFNNQDVLLEQTPRALSVTVAKALATCKNNKAFCKVLNMHPYMVTLKKGLKIAKAAGLVDSVATMQPCQPPSVYNSNNHHGDKTNSSVHATHHRTQRPNKVTDIDATYSSSNVNRADLDSFHAAYGFKLSPQLDEAQCYEALELLHRYKTVFARDMTEIQLCKGELLKLDLHSNRKMFKRQYRLSERDKIEMDRQIQQMEKAGVIEPSSTSYYNSPTYLVMKKNGQKRMVVDLRGINSLIVPKLVQLPQIEELLETITSSKPRFLSTMNILSAFYQVYLSEESRDLTTFTGPDGRRWRCTRCAMGLSCSPAQLNLVLSNIFCDKSRFHSLACYVDDILIFSQDWKAHLKQLELALKTLHENRISCSPTKTEIGYQEVEYLGHRLSADSIRISEKRVAAVDKIQPPKNVKGLQRVLGMFNYWKKYLPDYSKNTYHMRQLLKKDIDFQWTTECQKELDYLKKCLASDPILKPIDLNRDLIISCDASIYGIGFVIMQADDDGMLHAVRYGSYATTPAQANYSVEDLEAVALMYSLKSIEWLALCRHVTVLTDDTAVLHIQDWNPRNRRQRRMLTYIMQFDLTICYIRGSSNTTPDTLSRLFQDSSPQERRKNEPTYMHDIDDFILPITTRSHDRTLSQTRSLDIDSKPDVMDNIDDAIPSDESDKGGGTTILPSAPALADMSNPPP